jgi:predicted nucleic acid-binding Zn ribbon protein
MQRHNEQTIGEVLNSFLKASQLENRIFEDRIADIWQETLGDAVTAETERIHLQSGTLFVTLRSPSLRTELMMRRTAIAKVLNERLEGEVVKTVVIR